VHFIDFTNSWFEWVSSYFLWLNARSLWIDKKLNGIHIFSGVFFTSESMWNLFYYSSLAQPFSFCAGINVAAANILWIWLAFKYRKNK
jgi:hypothetical protein